MECVKFLNMKLNNRDVSVNNSSATSIKVFESIEFGKVRATLIDGKPWFVGIDIARIMGYKRPTDSVRDNVPSNHRMVVQLSDIQEYYSEPLSDHMKGSKITIIDESGLYRLVFKSTLPLADTFIEWVSSEVLPSIRETGKYDNKNTNTVIRPSLEEKVRGVGAAAELMKRFFNASDASLAAYINRGIEPLGLPSIDYVPSKGVKFSATDLLRKFNRSESIYKFNTRMLELGYLEEKTRVSRKSSNGLKKFKSITEKGLEFGENMVNPNNELETQPHYYENKFGELLSILFE